MEEGMAYGARDQTQGLSHARHYLLNHISTSLTFFGLMSM